MRIGSRDAIGLAMAAAVWTLGPADALGQKKQRDVISRAEIEGVMQGSADLFEVVRKLRPQFLEPPKGTRSLSPGSREVTNPVSGATGNLAVGGGPKPIWVSVDGRRETGTEALKTISPVMVQEVRYLDPSRAQNQFGLNASSGAIVVTLRKEEPAKPKDPPSP